MTTGFPQAAGAEQSSRIIAEPQHDPISRMVRTATVTEGEPADIAVSSRFYPGSLTGPGPQDLVLVSSDRVFFYVHSTALLASSSNFFASIVHPSHLSPPLEHAQHAVVVVRELSPVLNIILHAIYNLSCAQYSPSNGELIAAVDALPRYGISVQMHLAPETALFQVLTSRVHTDALTIYALAGHHNLYELASRASTHLLGIDIRSVPLEIADRMGAVYVNRLIALHAVRHEALKKILAGSPASHPFTDTCDEESQASLARAWRLATAYLIWEMRPRT